MRFPARRAVISGLALALLAACGKKPEAGVGGWERIKASGVLRVGLEGTYPPFNFQDKSGQLAGFEVHTAVYCLLAAWCAVSLQHSPVRFRQAHSVSSVCWLGEAYLHPRRITSASVPIGRFGIRDPHSGWEHDLM